jgi:hypothetical protein
VGVFRMTNASATCKEINDITVKLIKVGLVDDQNYAFLRDVSHNREEVTFSTGENFSYVLRNAPYLDIYKTIKQERDFNVSLADGAMLQLQYLFEGEDVVRHRLAFFPSPDLTEFQNEPEIYESDVIYAEILDRRVVATPMRFDFDRDGFIAEVHPMAHVTIGQYKNCRIPMRSALCPFRFFEFILKSFYNTAFNNYDDVIGGPRLIHPTTITPNEAKCVHVSLESRD